MNKRKIQIYAVTFVVLFLGAIALIAIKRDLDMDRLPIDTFVQAGHSFDIVHSLTCKCKH